MIAGRLTLGFLYIASSLIPGFALPAKRTPRQAAPGAAHLAEVFAEAPVAARALADPYAGRPNAVLSGRKLFRQHFAHCHGEDAQGRGKAPSLRTAAIQSVPAGVLFWFLKNGNLRAGMPSWSGLPDPQRWQLVSYLKSLR